MNKKSLRLIRQLLLLTPLWLGFANHLRADVITDWNGIAIPFIRTAPNITATRQLAMVHVAQFEAVNAVAGKYTPLPRERCGAHCFA